MKIIYEIIYYEKPKKEKKLLKTRIAVSAGKMMSAETSRAPTSFIARTITAAVIRKKIIL